MLWTLALLVGLAGIAPGLHRFARGATAWILSVVLGGLTAWYGAMIAQGPREEVLSWVPTLGVELSVRLDGLSSVFVLLITGIGCLVTLHAGGYLHGDSRLGRFYSLILLFLAAMLGLVLSDDLISLFVFWEVTSFASYLLIGFDHEQAAARKSAQRAFVLTGAGAVAMLAGFVLLRQVGLESGLSATESWRISALLELDLRSHDLYRPIVVLVLAGALTKSALMPFHSWLPGAMAAPTPVSALLHSATMVKAGIYLLARLHPALGQTPFWEWTLTSFGTVTMVVAALLTLTQKDLKLILAYSTLSVLGILTALLGLGTPLAIRTMVVFLVAHALYKATLFLIAGNIDHETGTRNVTQLSGLRRAMPFTAAAGIVAALSQAGAPPMLGFVGKELLYETKVHLDDPAQTLIIVAVVTNIMLVASAILVGIKPFLGRLGETPRTPHEAPWSMLLGPILLGSLGIYVGVFPDWFGQNLGAPMATAIAGYTISMDLALWHGVNLFTLLVLGLSFATLALGALVFVRVRSRLAFTRALAVRATRYGPSRILDGILDSLPTVADALTRRIQTGYLRHYQIVVLLVAIAAMGYPTLRSLAHEDWPARGDARPWEAAAAIMVLSGAAITILARTRLTAVTGLGASGMGVALLFTMFSAPDLAITQLMVEALTVILFVLVFQPTAPFMQRTPRRQRATNIFVALTVGGCVTLLMLAAASVDTFPRVSAWLTQASGPLAHGRNVVNVILVDFRALDTLGEITVVAVAGIGVLALIRSRRDESEKGRSP